MHRDECSRMISAAAPHARPPPAGESSARRETAWRTTSRLEKAFSRREVVPEVLDRRADGPPAGRGRGWGAAAEITRLHSSLCTLEAAGARDAERDQEMRGSIFERYSNRECIWFVKRVFGVFLLVSISPCEILRTNGRTHLKNHPHLVLKLSS